MEKTKLILLTLFASMIMISGFYFNTIQYANAVTVFDRSLGFNPRASSLKSNGDLWIVGGTVGGQLRILDTDTNTLGTTRNLSDDVVGITGTAEDVDCRGDICYIWVLNSGLEDAWLLRYSGTTFQDSLMWDIGGGTQIAIGGNEDTVFVPTESDGFNGADNCFHTGTVGHSNIHSIGWTGAEIKCTGLQYSTGADVTIGGLAWSGLLNSAGDTNDNHLFISQGASGVNEFHILNLGSFSAICTASGNNGGYVERIGSDYFVNDNGNTLRFQIDDTPNCVSDETVATANGFDGVAYNTAEDNLYLAEQTNDRIGVYNWTGSGDVGSLVQTFASETTGALQVKYSSAQNSIYFLIPSTSNVVRIIQLEDIAEEQFCIDIDSDSIPDVCYEDCDPEQFPDNPACGDGIPDATPFEVARAGQNVTSIAQNLCEQVGICPEGSDIRTNGGGYLVVVIMLGIMIVMFYLGSGGELGKIPTFVWVIGALSVLGSAVGIGFTDVVFFIIGVLVIIALASAKILSALERF